MQMALIIGHIISTTFVRNSELFQQTTRRCSFTACVSCLYNVTTHIHFLKGHQYSNNYQKRIEIQLFPFEKLPEMVQMDEPARSLLKFCVKLQNAVIQTKPNNCYMDWPALSLDMNSKENLWGRLARDKYAKMCKFETVQTLKLQSERS